MEEGTKPVAHYEIVDDMDVPSAGRGGPVAGLWSQLAVGQGFTVPIADFRRVRNAARIYWTARGGEVVSRKLNATTGAIKRVK